MASITNLGSVSGLPLEKILTDLAAANDNPSALRHASDELSGAHQRHSQLQSALEAVQSPPPRWASRRPWPP